MTKETCKLHPARPSVWHCDHCRHGLCTECVPGSRENHDGNLPRCAICNTELRYLGAANLAEPFWTQAHRLFGYPLQANGLIVLVMMGVVAALLPASFIGLIGLIMLFAFSVHYGLNVIEQVRNGDMTPPSLSEILKQQGEWLFFKQIGVFAVLGAFVYAGMRVSPGLGVLVLLLVLLAAPAATMMLAMTRSVTESVHPVKLAALMIGIGPSYLLLWICLATVGAAPMLVGPLLQEMLPEQVLFPAGMVVSSYFTFVTYAMMGYILYEKQAALGFASNDEFGETLEGRTFLVRKGIADARQLAAVGRHEAALETLVKAINIDQSNAELREFYYRVVSAMDDEEALRRNTNSICDFFVGRQLPYKAAQYCQETRKRFPDFVPAEARTCHLVAERFFEEGRYKDAAQLLMSLHRMAPKYPDMFAVLLLMARIFFEGMNAPEKASALLKQIRTRYPDHPELPKVDRLLEVISYRPATA